MYINHDRRASNLELEIPESTEDSAAIVLKKRQELEAGRNRGRFPPLFVDFFFVENEYHSTIGWHCNGRLSERGCT